MNHQPLGRWGKIPRISGRATGPDYNLITGYFWPLYSPVIELFAVS